MDIMNSKKTLLSLINGGAVLGAPAADTTVKFMYTTNLATAASNETPGGLVFAADGSGNAGIWSNGTLLTSSIQKVESAAQTGAKHGGKTITVTYVVAATGAVATSTFNVIDEAGLEAYFANSKTITLDTSTFEVKIKADGGLAVDNANGLYVDIADLFGVDNETIGFDENQKLKTLVKLAYAQSGEAGEPAIQLQNANDEALSEVTVAALIADGIVESTSYDAATNILTINWKGGAVTRINMAAIIDINDVLIAADSSNLLTATNDTSVAVLGTTAKLRNAVSLAESAIQGIEKGTSVENYVDLSVVTGNDPSTYAISIDDSDLNTKIVALDAKDAEIDSSIDALQAYDIVIDASIDRLDASVNALENAIKALDATPSDAVLDGSISISLTQVDGLITGVDLAATKSTVTFDNTPGALDLTATGGLLVADAVPQIKAYIDSKSGALDSSVTGVDAGGFVTVNTVQTDGALSAENVTVVYGDYANPQTDGIAKTSTTKTFVETEIQKLDLLATAANASAADNAGFVKTTISETDGIVKNESVEVTYGNYDTHTNGIAKTADTSIFVQEQITSALTWQILS